jgi:oligoribonuclease NrnB/cAMP/cGMP phosphodiesterase (DHH superfamily)
MEVFHISHNDLDGYSCVMISRYFDKLYENAGLSFTTVEINAGDIKEFELAISKAREYDLIIVTDLAINREMWGIIAGSRIRDKLIYIDHHVVPENMNDVITADGNEASNKRVLAGDNLWYFNEQGISAAKLYTRTLIGLALMKEPAETDHGASKSVTQFSRLLQTHDKLEHRNLRYYADIVSIYDTYEHVKDPSKPESIAARELNILFTHLNRATFGRYINAFIKDDSINTNLLTDGFNTGPNTDFSWIKAYLSEMIFMKDEYIKKICKKYPLVRLITTDGTKYLTAIVYTDRYVSDIGYNICLSDDSVDICVCITGDTVQFRSIKEDVDVSILARQLGGGGHKHASGAKMTQEMLEEAQLAMYNFIFDNLGNVSVRRIGSVTKS